MRALLFAGALLQAVCFGVSNGKGAVGTIVASSNNITTSYGSGAGSQILSSLEYKGNITVQNTTGTAIIVSYTSNTCSASSNDDMYVLNNTANTKYGAAIGSKVCVRSTSGTISSGTVYAEVW